MIEENRLRQKPNTQPHILAMIVGLVMILAIGLLTVFKNYHAGNEQNKAQKQAEENIKKAVKITAEDLQKKISQNEVLAIVDIRTPEEYEIDHIRDSKNISIGDFQNLWTSLDKNKTYVIVDDGQGLQGADIASQMTSNGFKSSYYLGGGYIAWKNKSQPTISGGNPFSSVDGAKATYISADDLNAWLSNAEERKDLFLIDLRTAQEYSQEHLEGSINIPLDELERREMEIPFAKDIAVYGNTDLFGFRGSVKLFDLGHPNVSSLIGGLDEWKKKGLKTIK